MGKRDHIQRIEPNLDGAELKIGIVMSRFNAEVGGGLLKACTTALLQRGVNEIDVVVATVPGALEIPLTLQHMAQTGDYDALIALGAVIRGETYHFEVVANQSASGIAGVSLDTGIPIANAVLTTDNDEQALARVETKGTEAAEVAIEMANLLHHLGSL